MDKVSREFQIFVKPAGAVCNLDCQYCYYRDKQSLYPDAGVFRMPESLLEEYIVQHFAAAPGPEIDFSWHGGEPTTLGVGFFRKAVELQRKHKPAGWRIRNGIQTNGVLVDEEWVRFLAAEDFSVGLSLDGPAVMRCYDLLRSTISTPTSFASCTTLMSVIRLACTGSSGTWAAGTWVFFRLWSARWRARMA